MNEGEGLDKNWWKTPSHVTTRPSFNAGAHLGILTPLPQSHEGPMVDQESLIAMAEPQLMRSAGPIVLMKITDFFLDVGTPAQVRQGQPRKYNIIQCLIKYMFY